MTAQQHKQDRPAGNGTDANPGAAPDHHAGKNKHGKSRALKIVLWILGILIAIPVIAIIILMTFDWNRIKPWLNAKVSDAIDRRFAINGDLSVHWERPSESIIPPGATTSPGRTCTPTTSTSAIRPTCRSATAPTCASSRSR
jgi:hypothetical protein